MIKIAGLLGLVLSFGLAGIGMAEDLRYRIRLLEEMQDLIMELKTRMNYFQEPMFSIFHSLEKKRNSRAFHLPGSVLLQYREKGGEIANLWAETAKELYENTPLTPDDLEIICSIGSYLGQSDYENQLLQFHTTEERIDEQLKQARTAFSQKGSMYRRVGFFAGALAAIVLI